MKINKWTNNEKVLNLFNETFIDYEPSLSDVLKFLELYKIYIRVYSEEGILIRYFIPFIELNFSGKHKQLFDTVAFSTFSRKEAIISALPAAFKQLSKKI